MRGPVERRADRLESGVALERSRRDGAPDRAIEELLDLTRAYLRQETVDSVRSLGRRLGYGLLGALCSGIGVVFLGSALLRAVPRHFGAASKGVLSSAVYFAAGLGMLGLLVLAWKVGMGRKSGG